MTKTKKLCPECRSNLFYHDNIHDEVTCRNCGLVLVAPNTHGLIFPGYYVAPRKNTFRINSKLSLPTFIVEYRF